MLYPISDSFLLSICSDDSFIESILLPIFDGVIIAKDSLINGGNGVQTAGGLDKTESTISVKLKHIKQFYHARDQTLK